MHAQAMGGDFNVVSEVGKGSVFTFTVRLPVADPSTPTIAHDVVDSALYGRPPSLFTWVHAGAGSRGHLRAWSCRAGLLEGKKVLVVEDNLVNQRVATKMLKSLGCSVTVRTIHQTKGPWLVPAKASKLTLHTPLQCM
jgi:hypothetical protein